MEYGNQQEALFEILKDTGCDDIFIEQFVNLWLTGKTDLQLTLLQKHRKDLLHKYHEDAKRIDHLDYLIYQIKRQEKQ